MFFKTFTKFTFVLYYIMQIIFRCSEEQKQEILSKQTSNKVELVFVQQINYIDFEKENVVFFDLLFDENNISLYPTTKNVFVHAVTVTCQYLPENYIRINAWNGFLKRNIVEVSTMKHTDYVTQIMQLLNWNFQFAPDEPGMISARIIAMIVNEGYFALENEVSTKEEIDIAMKLGTNYPYGPFEWSEKIGLKNIYHLLQKLNEQSARYKPSLLLQQTALHK